MSANVGGPPKGQPWVWITRDVMRSEAWRSMSVNARRLIDFLMIEHMNHGGRRNGYLLAPRDQLEKFGIGRRLITAAIEEVRTARLIAVKRGTGRRPSTFTLTWLPVAVHEGEQQSSVAVHEGEPQGVTKVNSYARSSARRCTAKGQIKGSPSCTPYRSSYQGSSINTGVSSAAGARQSRVNGHAAGHDVDAEVVS